MTEREFLNAHIPHRLAVLRGYLVAWSKQQKLRQTLPYDGHFPVDYDGHFGDLYRSSLDGAFITIRSLWSILGAKADNRNRQKLNKASPKGIPTGVSLSPFKQDELDKMPLAVLEVLVAADKCIAHMATDPYHNVDGAKMTSVINITFHEVERRIPGIPHAEFGRWRELNS
jgi:hypothetical protein